MVWLVSLLVTKSNENLNKNKMVKSTRKPSKYVVDLGPEIDKIVKKKDAKIKKHKVTILSLQSKLSEVENELKRYKVGRVNITNKTVENAFKNLRNGHSLYKMKPQTKRLIEMAGRWEEARKIHVQRLLI
jgi:guanylate kinase